MGILRSAQLLWRRGGSRLHGCKKAGGFYRLPGNLRTLKGPLTSAHASGHHSVPRTVGVPPSVSYLGVYRALIPQARAIQSSWTGLSRISGHATQGPRGQEGVKTESSMEVAGGEELIGGHQQQGVQTNPHDTVDQDVDDADLALCDPNLSWDRADSASDDPNVDDLLRNIEIAKTARTVEEAIPAKRKPSRLGVQRSSPMTIEEVVTFLKEERAVDVCVLHVPPEMEYVDYFVTCSGMGTRHIGRIADNLAAELKGVKFGRRERAVVEGRESEGWMAVEMGTIVVHLMSEEVRKKYELEKLWTLGRNYDDQYRELEAMSLDPSDNS